MLFVCVYDVNIFNFPIHIVSTEDDKHEMSKPLSGGNISKCHLLKSLPRVLVNISVVTHK